MNLLKEIKEDFSRELLAGFLMNKWVFTGYT